MGEWMRYYRGQYRGGTEVIWQLTNCFLHPFTYFRLLLGFLHPFMYFRLLLGAVETKVNRSINLQGNTVLTSMCLEEEENAPEAFRPRKRSDRYSSG